jgi:ribosomal protein S20
MEELHKRQLPEQRQIQEEQNAQIRALFDAVQLEKYDAMLKRIAERNKANREKNRPDGK